MVDPNEIAKALGEKRAGYIGKPWSVEVEDKVIRIVGPSIDLTVDYDDVDHERVLSLARRIGLFMALFPVIIDDEPRW